jgi:hypothetical protein
MSIPDDVDADALISRLAGPLSPVDRTAFRRAAEDALACIPCAGEGLAYRVVSQVWRGYFKPPDDHCAAWDISQRKALGRSKLASAAPVGRDDARALGRRAAMWARR